MFLKKMLCVAGLTVALIPAAGYAQLAPGYSEGDEPGIGTRVTPELTVSVTEHNFGTIDDTVPVSTKIAFRNTGSGTLIISNVHATCGCTVPALTKTTYVAGEAGEVSVSFNPQHKKGAQHQVVTLTSNDPVNPQKQVSILANVNPLVTVDPPMLQLGQIQRGTPVVKTVKIIGRLPNFAATGVTVNNAQLLSAKILGTKPVKDAAGQDAFETEIELAVAATAPVGVIQANATIRTTDANRTENVSVWGEIIGDIQAVPPRVSLGALLPGAPITTTVKLNTRSGKNFKITGTDDLPATDGGMPSTGVGNKLITTVTQDDPAKPNSYTVTITGTAPTQPGALRGDIVLKTDLADEPEFKLQYVGFTQSPKPPQPAGPFQPSPTGAPAADLAKPLPPKPAPGPSVPPK